MRKAFGAMMGDDLAIEAQAHFVAFGDEDEVMPLMVGFPRNGVLLGLKQGIEVGRELLFPREAFLSALANLEIHNACLVIDQLDAVLGENGVA